MWATAAAGVGESVSRTCDLDAPDGPFEVGEEDWDGVSVWIGNIPAHAVTQDVGEVAADAVLDAIAWRTGAASAQRYTLSADFVHELNTFGEGLQADRTEVFENQRTWAVVTYCRRQDAEACLSSTIGSQGTYPCMFPEKSKIAIGS